MPCYASLLGLTSDPLVWPPHHVSIWSPRGLRFLAGEVGLELVELHLEPCSVGELHTKARMEPTRHLPGWAGRMERFLRLPGMGKFGPGLMRLFSKMGFEWAQCSHSVLGIFRVIKS